MTTEELIELKSVLIDCDSELSAYAHGRTLDKEDARCLAWRCRVLYERVIPKVGYTSVVTERSESSASTPERSAKDQPFVPCDCLYGPNQGSVPCVCLPKNKE